ncbi:F-box protein SKIP23-like [Nicotiana sylvestris]|uniref:F-box protein At2g26160-like n=2 Tax=Nicotiana TaxID=4085 RepID=A0A1S3Y5B8_TOBAC|nr:PREDICTED: F-box protein At2g26160-like [Nicotiana sylvestris]XP_016447087.1 PREDICTED: F-box protein At2g26160-like [Nicotiana tabacum]
MVAAAAAAAVAAVAVPLLMLAEEEEKKGIREFWDLSKGVTYSMNFPELVGKCCFGVGFPGWLFTADEQGHMNLFHLFSRSLINLPDMDMLEGFDYEVEKGHCTQYVEKAVISSDPLISKEDYVLALIQGSPRTFAFWRPGSKSFTSVSQIVPERAYSDIAWHDGQFYGVDFEGNVIVFDFRSGDYPTSVRVIRSEIPPEVIDGNQVYIVYSMGELLVINRDGAYEDDDTGIYGAKQFHVYKINDIDSSYSEVKDLGDRALFVGNSATVVVEQLAHGIKGSHIYYTDDCKDTYFSLEQGGGKDMGVYNLLDGTIVPHYTGQSYHKLTPPLWIFSNSPSLDLD